MLKKFENFFQIFFFFRKFFFHGQRRALQLVNYKNKIQKLSSRIREKIKNRWNHCFRYFCFDCWTLEIAIYSEQQKTVNSSRRLFLLYKNVRIIQPIGFLHVLYTLIIVCNRDLFICFPPFISWHLSSFCVTF